MGYKETFTEALIDHLCLGYIQSFAQYFHKIESILERAKETVKKIMGKELDEEKDLSRNNEKSKNDINPSMFSYDKIGNKNYIYL